MKEFNVPDMKCAHCEKTIKKAFKKEGIDVVINLKKKKIYLPPTLDEKTVADIIEKADYTISNNITAEEKH